MTAFDDLVDEYLREHFEESPVAATSAGWDGFDDRLPDLSAEGFARRSASQDRWYERLSSIPDADLSADEQIDRDLIRTYIRGAQITRDWEVWRRQPDGYLGSALSGVFTLFLHRLHPEPELVASAIARLDAVAGVLDHARANLDPDRVCAALIPRAIGQCRAGASYSRDLLPTEVEDPDLRAKIADAGNRAAGAYESFIPFLEDLAASARGDFALGEHRYSALLKEKEGLPFDAAGLRARGQTEYDALAAEMSALATEVGGRDDWRSVLDEVNADAPASPEAMLAGYADATEQARQYLADHGLVSFPEGEGCDVLPSPPFQRPVLAVASYFAPPAFRPSLIGRFNVPYPPDGTAPQEVAQRLADNSYPSMPTTSVHEAYPGHHWHYAMMQANARPIRLVLSTAYFVEGWGLYSERMMHEQGFFADPRAALCHLDARIFRAARIVVDTSLHSGEMTIDEAIVFMTTKASLTEPTARAEVLRYCAWPTQAASYLTGSLEIERIRETFLSQGKGDLRAFHDRLCASGALPLALAERAVLA